MLRENYPFKQKECYFEFLITSWKIHVETGHSLMQRGEFYYFLFFSKLFLEVAVSSVSAFPGMSPDGEIG